MVRQAHTVAALPNLDTVLVAELGFEALLGAEDRRRSSQYGQRSTWPLQYPTWSLSKSWHARAADLNEYLLDGILPCGKRSGYKPNCRRYPGDSLPSMASPAQDALTFIGCSHHRSTDFHDFKGHKMHAPDHFSCTNNRQSAQRPHACLRLPEESRQVDAGEISSLQEAADLRSSATSPPSQACSCTESVSSKTQLARRVVSEARKAREDQLFKDGNHRTAIASIYEKLADHGWQLKMDPFDIYILISNRRGRNWLEVEKEMVHAICRRMRQCKPVDLVVLPAYRSDAAAQVKLVADANSLMQDAREWALLHLPYLLLPHGRDLGMQGALPRCVGGCSNGSRPREHCSLQSFCRPDIGTSLLELGALSLGHFHNTRTLKCMRGCMYLCLTSGSLQTLGR